MPTDYELQAKTDAEKIGREISNYLNSYGHDTRIKALVEVMNQDHRTLQQSFTKLCVAWLNHCGDPEYRTDGRNEASAQLGKAFRTLSEDTRHLPFI